MLFHNNRRRLEEDLERVRKANLPPEALEAEEAQEMEIRRSFESGEIEVTAKDILAMTIAMFSLILPYVLIIVAGMGLVLLWFFR